LDENNLLIATITEKLSQSPQEAYLFQQRLHANLQMLQQIMNYSENRQ